MAFGPLQGLQGTGFGNFLTGAGTFFGAPGMGISENVGAPTQNPNADTGYNGGWTNGAPGGGQVLGASTSHVPVNYGNQNVQLPAGPQLPPPPGGGSQTQAPATQVQNQAPQQTFDPYAALRGQISSGWDNYIGQLGDMLNNGLPQQQSAQNNIINDQYNQGQSTINSQKSASLKDIANTIKNAFQAGNNYLGARGAGDSSAGDMFNFATNQEANKQTSDLNQYVNTQLGNLASQRDQQLNGVANWYADAQNQLKQAIANGSLSKSQDLSNLSSNILNQGLSMINQIHQDAQSKYNALTQWAANNSGSLGALKNNIASIGAAPASPIQMDSSGNLQVPVGYGYSNNQDQTQNPNQGLSFGSAGGGTGGGLFSTAGLFQ